MLYGSTIVAHFNGVVRARLIRMSLAAIARACVKRSRPFLVRYRGLTVGESSWMRLLYNRDGSVNVNMDLAPLNMREQVRRRPVALSCSEGSLAKS